MNNVSFHHLKLVLSQRQLSGGKSLQLTPRSLNKATQMEAPIVQTLQYAVEHKTTDG